ncbi:MAG TPA: glucosaminidase domain-containing protein [Chitinophaga sp.]|uniref:glucosaminidase domain-containing protein n=1 Tax=Chitinophaga sp. TaxID=1869181 RepID=UPI002DB822B6|nr:glucosaminidase domain-containing protein [Chitinophaga sp.]HEU4552865.1 glucosaminidase domain-containing protein [Chitinophaga sp.]
MQVRKYGLVVSFLIGCMPVLKAQTKTMTTEQYIATYKDIAIDEMRTSGIPAAVTLAQGVLETQSGNGWLVLNSNNHFGIKCKNNWVGPTVNYDDDARQECFRKYNSAADSYRDHSAFLKNNPRYAFLFQFDQKDYKSWAYGLKQAGYATSRTYPQQLIKIIEDYNLEQYTDEGLGIAKTNRDNNNTGAGATRPEPADIQPPAVAAVKTAPKPATSIKRPSGVFEINDRKVLYLPAGTPLIQIAERYDIRLSRLLQYNDLAEDVPLPNDMYIYLQKKGKKGKDDYHTVAPGETMYDVAQAEGIQLKWLRRRNKMKQGQEPAPGVKLALDGYASATPRLAKNQPVDENAGEDFSIKKAGDDIEKEIAKNQATQQASQPAAQTQAGGTPPAQKGGIPVAMVEDLKKVGEVKMTPAAGQQPRTTGILQYHDVQPKETAYGIAKRYNITIEQLQRWNNLQGTDIKIGQRLLVGK